MAKKFDEDLAVQIFQKKGCNVTSTCQALGITRKTFYEWKNKKPKFAEKLNDAEEALLDFAESKLIEHIQKGDTQTLMFYLKTEGKKRGYVEKTETDVTVNKFEELMKSVEDED